LPGCGAGTLRVFTLALPVLLPTLNGSSEAPPELAAAGFQAADLVAPG